MKTFELSQRMNKNGRRKFTMVLHEIYPEDCIDEVNEKGTMFNKNGITWIREYCDRAKDTIQDMSLRAEFLDDDRTELCGHGDTGVEDGLPIFENADILGHFTKGYINTITDENGDEHTVMMADGYIDEMCHKNYVAKLEADIANGNPPFGSVEIFRTDDNDGIVYKYGYKREGRIPSEFIYSGYALLGVMPADDQAKIVELNRHNKEDECVMTEAEIKTLVEQTVNEMSNHTAEINECKQDCETKINEANAAKDAAINEKNEAIANSEQIQTALEECRAELSEAYKKIDGLYAEINVLNDELGKAKAKERIGELNDAIARFSDEQREYAKEEIESFKADPVNSEVNAVVDKILREIGNKAIETAEKEAEMIAEQNSASNKDIDIFSGVASAVNVVAEDTNIF